MFPFIAFYVVLLFKKYLRKVTKLNYIIINQNETQRR